MAVLGFVPSRANIKSASISSWYVRAKSSWYSCTFNNTTNIIISSRLSGGDGKMVMVAAASGGALPSELSAATPYYIITTGDGFCLSLTSGGAAVDFTDNGNNCLFQFVDQAYYPLSNLYEGKILIKSQSQKDSVGRNLVFGADMTASAKIFSTGKASVLKTLDAISQSDVVHAINTQSGCISPVGLSVPRFGTKWKFVCDSDSDKNRYIEISTTRKIAKSESTELMTTAAPTYGSAYSYDQLYALNSITKSDIIPAGFSKFEVCDTSGGVFLDIGEIMNGKFTAELLTQKDSLGCEIGYAIKIDVSVEAMQASATELALMENLSSVDMYFKITLLDGTVITLSNQTGIDWEFHCEKDSDGVAFISYNGTGVIQATSLDNVFI